MRALPARLPVVSLGNFSLNSEQVSNQVPCRVGCRGFQVSGGEERQGAFGSLKVLERKQLLRCLLSGRHALSRYAR